VAKATAATKPPVSVAYVLHGNGSRPR